MPALPRATPGAGGCGTLRATIAPGARPGRCQGADVPGAWASQKPITPAAASATATGRACERRGVGAASDIGASGDWSDGPGCHPARPTTCAVAEGWLRARLPAIGRWS